MSTIGQLERKTQQRVVKLFQDKLGYAYLGDWEERVGNRNVEPELLRAFLKKNKNYDDGLINKALHQLEKAAGDTSKSLYDRNEEVYGLLRYGVKVKPDVGENTVTIHLINWKHPELNDFAIAEEVTVLAADAKAHTKPSSPVGLSIAERSERLVFSTSGAQLACMQWMVGTRSR